MDCFADDMKYLSKLVELIPWCLNYQTAKFQGAENNRCEKNSFRIATANPQLFGMVHGWLIAHLTDTDVYEIVGHVINAAPNNTFCIMDIGKRIDHNPLPLNCVPLAFLPDVQTYAMWWNRKSRVNGCTMPPSLIDQIRTLVIAHEQKILEGLQSPSGLNSEWLMDYRQQYPSD